MQNLKRNRSKISAKLLICQQFLSKFSKNNRLEPKNRPFSKINKRHLRADVLSLLSSALRPRLLGALSILNYSTTDSRNTYSKKSFFSSSRGSFGFNVAKIVALSTILGISGLFSFVSSTPVFADSLTLTIPSSPLSLDLNPSVNNGFATTSGTFNVKTINSSGYTVSIKSKNEDGSNSLVSGENKLNSITEATTEDNFKNDSKFLNMWGWMPSRLNSEDNTSYQIAPGKDEVVLDKIEEASGDTGRDYNISLAAKVANDTPIGTYANTFVVNVLANQNSVYIEGEPEECEELTEIGQTGTFTDQRDQNVYTIARLKDGRCWMTQNLRIVNKTISPDDSNEEGTFIIPDSNLQKFSYKNEGEPNVYIDQDNTYGGYYDWYAATAGMEKIVSDKASESSICPKNWHLPTQSEFTLFSEKYNGNEMISLPVNLSLPGNAFGSSEYGVNIQGKDQNGCYWSSRLGYSFGHGGEYPQVLYVSKDNSGIKKYWPSSQSRGTGCSVRCIAGTTPKSYKVTFKVGQGIDAIIVAGKDDELRPHYALKGSETSIVLEEKQEAIVTVVPEPGYKLDSWSSDNNYGKFRNRELLTTVFVAGKGEETITANGIEGSYISMQQVKNSDCNADGLNVTDERDKKSYAVKKIGQRCFMLSNLRLEGGTRLDPETSDVQSIYNLPIVSPIPRKLYYGKAWVGECNIRDQEIEGGHILCDKAGDSTGEYYYNWYAAKANPYETSNPLDSKYNTLSADNKSLGSICPKGWTLPDYTNDITVSDLLGNGDNPAMLINVGIASNDSNSYVGDELDLHSSVGSAGEWQKVLYFASSEEIKLEDRWGKRFGQSVRCVISE